MEIKFTSDGKKVAVLGKLNSTDHIVQEIFIIGDQEIPSGENFVVKSLHDAPAITWRETELKRVKEKNDLLIGRLESENKQYESQLDAKRQKFKEQSKILSDKFKFIANAVKNADESSFNTLLSFLEGRIKYLVVGDTYSPDIILFTQFVEKYSDSDYWSGINLISLWGGDDGTLQYRVGDYYDGYKTFTDIIPFETEEVAIAKLTEIIGEVKEYNQYTLTAAKKYNIKLDHNKVKIYKDKTIANYQNSLEQQQKQVNNYQKLIEDLQNN